MRVKLGVDFTAVETDLTVLFVDHLHYYFHWLFIYVIVYAGCGFCRVMVLQNGKMIEFEQPALLLQNKESAFHSMAKDAGLV